MKLERLSLKNFMSYEDCELVLSDISVCSIIGGNGSGKSTIIEAILWAIFGHAKLNNKDLVRSGQDHMAVELGFTLSGHAYHLVREYEDGSVKLRATIDDKEVGQGTQALSAMLLKNLRVSRELLMESVAVTQGQLSSFLDAIPSQRRDVVIRALGLNRFVKAGESARDTLKEAQASLNAQNTNVSSIQSRLDALPGMDLIDYNIKESSDKSEEAIKKVEELKGKRDVLLSQDQEARQQYQELSQEVQSVQDRMKSKMLEFDKKIKDISSSIENTDRQLDQLELIRQVIVSLDQDFQQASALAERARDLRLHIERLNAEIENRKNRLQVASQGNDVCPVCNTPLSTDRWKEIIGSMKEELNKLITNCDTASREFRDIKLPGDPANIMKKLEETRDKASRIEGMADTKVLMENQKQALAEQKAVAIQELEHQLTALNTKIDATKVRINAEVELLNQQIRTWEIRRTDLQVFFKEWFIKKSKRDDLDKMMIDEKVRLEDFKRDFPCIEFAAQALSPNGIPLMLTDHYLPVIESKAQDLLHVMSDGKLQLKLDVVDAGRKGIELMAGTDTLRPIRSLSGGEKTRSGLAIRLAISQLLFEMANCQFDCLLVDEPEFLDPAGISQFIQAINGLRSYYGQIFVMSHHDALKHAFPHVIEVEKTDDVSFAKIIT